MQYAMEYGNIEQFKILLAVDSAVNALLQNSKGGPLLQTAVRSQKLEIVSLLLEAGVDVNEIHEPTDFFGPATTALHVAGEVGNMEMMKILLEAGARINALPTPKYPNTTLWHAVEGGNLEVANTVLVAGADVNSPPYEMAT